LAALEPEDVGNWRRNNWLVYPVPVGGFIKFVLFLAVVLTGAFFALQATCIEIWTVPSDDPLFSASVMPTLEAGDTVLLWRLGTPRFADLVRCADPQVPGRFVVGRILGEHGDYVKVEGAVFVNGRIISAAHGCPVGEYAIPHPISGEPTDMRCESEEAGGNDYTRLRLEKPTGPPEKSDSRVPNEHVFIVSDDRPFHYDSRDFGPLPTASCPERIVFRLWSIRGWSDAARRLSMIH
jgi:signal peptidase I